MTDKLEELTFRRQLAKHFINMIDQIEDEELASMGFTQEQKQSALEEYKRQLAAIDQKITDVTGTPPPVVVGLKTARLFGNANLKQ